MTIFNAGWLEDYRFVLARLAVAHRDLSGIAAILRNQAHEVWTERPSDASKVAQDTQAYSLEGWRSHFRGEFQRLNQINTLFGVQIGSYDPQAKTALDGYLLSIPTIGAAFRAATAAYEDGSGDLIQTKLAQADRNTLAAAIEAELQ